MFSCRLAAVLVVSIASLANAAKPSTLVGTLKLHELKFGDKPRTIRVWLPPDYESAKDRRYPVLYMHDGQNLFDAATAGFGEWQVDEAFIHLLSERKVEPAIVVGVDNGGNDRIAEMTFVKDHDRGGNAMPYEAFIVHTVKPFIDETYRTKPDRDHTLMGGSSLGALVSLEIARHNPMTFGKLLVVSPSLWWANEQLTRELAVDASALGGMKIWIDIGRKEIPDPKASLALVGTAQRLDLVLSAANVTHQLVIDDQGEHNEKSWARRFPDAMAYLLPPEPSVNVPTTAPAATMP